VREWQSGAKRSPRSYRALFRQRAESCLRTSRAAPEPTRGRVNEMRTIACGTVENICKFNNLYKSGKLEKEEKFRPPDNITRPKNGTRNNF